MFNNYETIVNKEFYFSKFFSTERISNHYKEKCIVFYKKNYPKYMDFMTYIINKKLVYINKMLVFLELKV